jgi:hypothetical protein
MNRDAEEKAARIWDALAKLEGEGLRDADRMEQAKEFKRQYLERQQGVDFKRIKTAWLKWQKEEAVPAAINKETKHRGGGDLLGRRSLAHPKRAGAERRVVSPGSPPGGGLLRPWSGAASDQVTAS